MKLKQFKAEEVTVNVGSREVIAVISTDAIDREGEIVIPSGLIKTNYGGNPVVMYSHNWQSEHAVGTESLPIGTTRWVKQVNNTIVAKYYVSDKTQFARDIFGLLQDGVLKAHSVGFTVLEESPPTPDEIRDNPEWANARNIVRQWELLEFSVVPIPCNPEALTMAVAKGYSPETIGFLGDDFAPIPDCFEPSPVVKTPEPVAPVVDYPTDNRVAVPVVKSKRRTQKEIDAIVERVSAEVIARIKGKA